MQANVLYYLTFSHALGVGPMKFDALLKAFGSVEAAYNASEAEFTKVAGVQVAKDFKKFKREFDAQAKLEECKRKSITVVTREDPRFPQQLLEIPDVPICLYVKGDIEAYDWDDEQFFAIVGTRRATSYGQQISYKFARELGESGFTIVSGLALGIDSLAHRGGIDAGARTIAFLGCGVDIVYPPSNKLLYEKILSTGGLIISEFPPGHTVLRGLFVARNRLISGLSKGVLVVEGAKDSGALITARYAAEQGKDVFAPPVPITSLVSEAPNILLKEGAKLVTSMQDIIEEYDIPLSATKNVVVKDLNEEEQNVFELLRGEPHRVGELAVATKKGIDATLQVLTMMELKGLVEKNSEGRFQLKISSRI